MSIFRHFLWWTVEMIIGYFLFYIVFYAMQNPVHIGSTALICVLLVSFGVFASPFTRHLSFWNRVIDEVVKKEEEKTKYTNP